MGMPAAKKGDKVIAVDIHIVMIPSPGGPVPTPLPSPFNGMITGNCCETVTIGGMAAATVGSIADNVPPHIPAGGPFQMPPTNKANIIKGSATVMIGGKPAARSGDLAQTCQDIPTAPGQIIAVGTVLIGG